MVTKISKKRKNKTEQFAGARSQLHLHDVRRTLHRKNRLLYSYFMFAYGLDNVNKR